MIHLDTANPRVGADEGEALFLPFGGDSPYLERIMKTLQVIHQGTIYDKTLFSDLRSRIAHQQE